jgi:hypothetical protein
MSSSSDEEESVQEMPNKYETKSISDEEKEKRVKQEYNNDVQDIISSVISLLVVKKQEV